jgi:hypothetical protein
MEEGRYEIILTAKDSKGYELEEKIGELELIRGRDGASMRPSPTTLIQPLHAITCTIHSGEEIC